MKNVFYYVMHKLFLSYIMHLKNISSAIISRELVVENHDFTIMDLPDMEE
jgi:hypothetical protein